ncbi:MAG: ABC transporter ATP-binding protein [Halobacteriaceae archaeon]
MSQTAGFREMPEGADPDAPLVQLDDVSVHFESESFMSLFTGPNVVHAVDDVTLDIEENDVVVLVGESGSGKTTLGKTSVALQRPTSGSVKYRGQDIYDAKDGTGEIDIRYSEIRRALQIVHQDPDSALHPMHTVLDQLSEPLRRWRDDMDAGGRRERIYNVLEQVGMTPAPDYASRYPHQLSGGEKQRVVLCRALLMDPELVMADEAVSALDVSLRIEMMDLMLDLQDIFDTSYLFISHTLSNARYIAEKADGRIGVMYLGNLVELGPPEEVIQNPKHPYTKVLKWATPSLSLDDEHTSSPPIREIDIPDAQDPPAGCRFHTRCPYARETCTQQYPTLDSADDSHSAACFRQYDDHEYWSSEWLDAEAAEEAAARED